MPRDPAGFEARFEQFAEASRIKGHSEDTINRSQYSMRKFFAWCEERGIFRPTDITRPILERYQRHLFHTINPRTDRPLSLAYQQTILVHIRSFFRWLIRQNLVLYNPAADIDIPRRDNTLPTDFLSREEIERVLTQPNLATAQGLRDRAIMETFYSTGIRRMEICNLKIDDAVREQGVVIVRKGKGRKDRVVPIGERALQWIAAYTQDARHKLVAAPDERWLFVSNTGKQIPRNRLNGWIRGYLRKSDIQKRGASPISRHTFATHMHQNGADIRFIQAMLGHKGLATTERYTHVVIDQLKKIHAATHPAAQMKPAGPADSAISRPPD